MSSDNNKKILLGVGAVVAVVGGLFLLQRQRRGNSEQKNKVYHSFTSFDKIDAGTFYCSGCFSMKEGAGKNCSECEDHRLCVTCAGTADILSAHHKEKLPEQSGGILTRDIDLSALDNKAEDKMEDTTRGFRYKDHPHTLEFREEVLAGVFFCSGCEGMKSTSAFECETCIDKDGYYVCADCFENPPAAKDDNGIRNRGGDDVYNDME